MTTTRHLHFIDIMALQSCCIHHMSYQCNYQPNKNIQVLLLIYICSLLLPHPNPNKSCCWSTKIINHCSYPLIIPTPTIILVDVALITQMADYQNLKSNFQNSYGIWDLDSKLLEFQSSPLNSNHRC